MRKAKKFMEKSVRRFTRIGCAVVAGMLISHWQTVMAGWSGIMNGVGFGWASVDVVSSSLKEKTLTTPSKDTPAASMPTVITNGVIDSSYTNSSLPNGSSIGTVSRIKGSSGYVWQAITVGNGGDGTDNKELTDRITIKRANCTSLSLNSPQTPLAYDPMTHSGTITLYTTGTTGTGLWLRLYEAVDANGQPFSITGVPEDDPNTPDNETIDYVKAYLKAFAQQRAEYLLVGPFDFGAQSQCGLVIPFTIETTTDNLYFVSDGVALSNPLLLDCPNNLVFDCNGPASYPPPTVTGGCGNVTVTYNPPVSSLPLGVSTVTATATDAAGNTATDTFTVTRNGILTFDGFYSPVGTEGTDCSKVFKTSELTKLGQVIPIKFKTFCNSVNYSAVAPTYFIEKCTTALPHPIVVPAGTFTFVSSEWHGQFDTGAQGITSGKYVIHVLLQDGTTKQIAVQLK